VRKKGVKVFGIHHLPFGINSYTTIDDVRQWAEGTYSSCDEMSSPGDAPMVICPLGMIDHRLATSI